MQPFDIALKSLLQDAGAVFLRLLTGHTVRRWLDVELPQVKNRRVDRLGQTESGSLLHLELQTSNDGKMPLRMAQYYLDIYELYLQPPQQIVLYVGKKPMDMPSSLTLPGLAFHCEVVDIRQLDGDPMLASANINDNILAILAQLKHQGEAVHRIVSQIATLEESQRQSALAQLLILAGLRGLEEIVRKEIVNMSDTINLLENTVLGPMILQKLDEGRQEGLQTGLQQGRLSILSRQLEKRFGPLSHDRQEQLSQLSLNQLDEISVRLLDIGSLDELFS